jgi:hypothetical protein
VYTDGAIIANTVDDHMQKEELEYEILPYSELLEPYMLIHLKGQVVINIQKDLVTVQEEVQEQLTKVALGVFSFYCKSSGVFLINDEEVAGIDGGKSVENLIVKDEDGKKKKSKSSEMVCTNALNATFIYRFGCDASRIADNHFDYEK